MFFGGVFIICWKSRMFFKKKLSLQHVYEVIHFMTLPLLEFTAASCSSHSWNSPENVGHNRPRAWPSWFRFHQWSDFQKSNTEITSWGCGCLSHNFFPRFEGGVWGWLARFQPWTVLDVFSPSFCKVIFRTPLSQTISQVIPLPLGFSPSLLRSPTKNTAIFPADLQFQVQRIPASDLPCFRFAGSDAHLILKAPKAGGAGRVQPRTGSTINHQPVTVTWENQPKKLRGSVCPLVM